MEAGTTGTGSQTGTIAGLAAAAGERYGDRVAVQYKRGGEWHERTYNEVVGIVQEIALGLIALGIEPGERICILCTTREEWTYCDLAATSAGLVVVPIYPTNSPDECHWVISDSEAVAIIAEDDAQLAKIAEVRDRLPDLREIVVIDGDGGGELGARTLASVRALGAEGDVAELEARRNAVRPEDPYTFIYTSGTTGNPKGCVLTHGNYAAVTEMVASTADLTEDEITYLYLPLAHAYALLIQLLAFHLGSAIAYFGGDTRQIIPELMEVKPTYLPSVPRIFEKIYTLARASIDAKPPEERAQADAAIALGVKVREMMAREEEIPPELAEPFEKADAELFANVRALFGGRCKRATSGAAPIAKEILEFFYACGIAVLEGYGMTETSTAATFSSPTAFRYGTVGRALPGVEIRIADDGEVLLKGANIFAGYHNRADAGTFGDVVDGWLHTGDLGSLDEDGFLTITGRKKDIIITAGGKNLTPANIENDLKQSRWISQAVMYGDRRPYPVVLVTLDEEEIPAFAKEHGLAEDIPTLSRDPEIHALIQAEVDRVNAKYAQVEQVKRFAILDHDLSQPTGELTPTLKVKRNVVNEKYAEIFESLYRDA
ncbi:MAG TPA: long-chain fatty acid--CoA ligase [Solirubrobacteraceae bacterium]|nr:long-chain fatty acid--CoA ligase [Solirubrobacteraceae bacterium]